MKKPKLCATCLAFYCCNLSQVTQQCPVKKKETFIDRPVVFGHPKTLYTMENQEPNMPFTDGKTYFGDDDHHEGKGRE